jgi:DNA replication protein DnaC
MTGTAFLAGQFLIARLLFSTMAHEHLGMRKLGPTAAEELLEIVMRRYDRASTLVTFNRPVEDWGKLLGAVRCLDSAAVTAMLDRLLHHGHILKCGPRSWRTKLQVEP